MPSLDPKAEVKGENNTTILPAGRYPLGLVWFKRKTSGKGLEYLSIKLEVCSGPAKGQAIWAMLSLNLAKTGAVRRLQILCEAFGIEESFEVGSKAEGTAEEGDANFTKLFVGRAFVAEVSVTKSGDYTNNDLEKLVFLRDWRDYESKAIAAWEADWKSKKAQESDDFGDPDASGDERPNFGSDDDIPF